MAPSIDKSINWVRALKVLDIVPDSPVLPCTVKCPIHQCGGPMTIYHDYTTTGHWFHCSKCDRHGDILDMFCQTWDQDVHTVLYKLSLLMDIDAAQLLPDRINAHILSHPNKRRRLEEFWDAARKRLIHDDNKELRGLQHKLGVRNDLEAERWLAGAGKYLGGTFKDDVEIALRVETAKFKKTRKSHDRKILLGPNWGDLLVIQFHDLPRRPKAYLFIGRDANIPEDTRLHHVKWSPNDRSTEPERMGRREEYDCGIAMYEALLHTKPEWDHHVFALANPFAALRLHRMHFKDNTTTLPIVSVFSDKTYTTASTVWASVRSKLIFWGYPNSELFRHAHATNSKVCLEGFDEKGPVQTFYNTPPAEWLTKVYKNARPWNTTLESVLAKLSDADAEALVAGMLLKPAPLNKLLASFNPQLRDRLYALTKIRPPQRITTFDNVSITEKDGSWVETRAGELVTEGILRIDSIVHYQKLAKTYYIGRILFHNVEIPFKEEAEIVEDNTFKWMHNFLIRRGIGFMDFSSKWTKHGVRIAGRFHTPDIRRGLNAMGWDQKESCFVFPKYVISQSGEVLDATSVIDVTCDNTIPARHLRKPQQLSSEDVKELSDSDVSSLIWATTLAVASNLLAPVYDEDPCKIALCGQGAVAIGKKTALMLGCSAWTTPSFREEPEAAIDKIIMMTNEHEWPLVLSRPAIQTQNIWASVFNKPAIKNCIVELDWYSAQSVATRPNWHLIECDEYKSSIGIVKAVSKILPSFLQYIAKQRFKLPLATERGDIDTPHRVHQVLSDWFITQGGESRAVYEALKMINLDCEEARKTRPLRHFINILCRLLHDGDLGMERTGFIGPGTILRSLVYITGSDGRAGRIFIAKAAINKALADHGAPPLDTQIISRALATANLLLEEGTYGGLAGWTIPEPYFNMQMNLLNEKLKYILKEPVSKFA